jgi:hypothetical protein
LAGVEFIDENGGGPGVRLRKRHGRNNLGRQFLAAFLQIDLKRLRRAARKPRLLRLFLRQSVRARRRAAGTARHARLSRAFLATQRQLDNIGQDRPDESWDGLPMWLCASPKRTQFSRDRLIESKSVKFEVIRNYRSRSAQNVLQ